MGLRIRLAQSTWANPQPFHNLRIASTEITTGHGYHAPLGFRMSRVSYDLRTKNSLERHVEYAHARMLSAHQEFTSALVTIAKIKRTLRDANLSQETPRKHAPAFSRQSRRQGRA